MSNYKILMSIKSAKKISAYKQGLISGELKLGHRLKNVLNNQNLKKMSNIEFLNAILATKKTQFFAETDIKGGGFDWNNSELDILGDVNVAVPVTIFDNMGRGNDIKVHREPFKGELLFTPGCLLRGDAFKDGESSIPDYAEVIQDERLNQDAFNRLITRRLLPLFYYVNRTASEYEKAIINIPGIGCGQFAGRFIGKMGNYLDIALRSMFKKYGQSWPNIQVVRFDPFNECVGRGNESVKYGTMEYRIRPLVENKGKTQLCHPVEYQEDNDNFKNCKLYKIVAWDHVSLPGNDFWIGSRATDDGIAAAATDSMNAFAIVEGTYDPTKNHFVMPNGSSVWKKTAKRLVADGNLEIMDKNGNVYNNLDSILNDHD